MRTPTHRHQPAFQRISATDSSVCCPYVTQILLPIEFQRVPVWTRVEYSCSISSSLFEQPSKQQYNNMTMHCNTKNETISSDIVKFKVSDIHGP